MPNLNSQKIFDIIPPGKIERKIPSEKRIKGIKTFRPRTAKPIKMFLGIILFLLILGGLLFYFIFQKAEIVIWPKTEKVSFEEKVIVDLEVGEVEFATNAIPGKIIKEEQSINQEFSSSGMGSKETKAKGIIRVYNNYQLSQILVANTRFQPPLERVLYFRTTRKTTIPSKNYVDVEVIADKAGVEYNIGPSTFSVPGLAGLPQYTFVYGKSFQSMEGGVMGEASEVIQQDLDKAGTILKENLLIAAQDSLRNKVSEDIIILEEAAKKDFSEPIFSAEAGDEKTSFAGEGKLSFTALIFKKSDLESFAKEYILSQISKDQEIYSKSLKIDYSLESVDLERGKMVLNLSCSADVFFKIGESDLKNELSGKPLSEAQDFSADDPRIKKLEIDLWPFWINKVPLAIDKIIIKQKIDSELISP